MRDEARLPNALQEAMERLLDADADSDRGSRARSHAERIDALRAARAVVTAWRRGEIDQAEAVTRIDALTRPAP